MEDGKITGTQIFPNNSESDSWTIWSPGPTTELTQMVVHSSNPQYFTDCIH